jgi:hypothetical protein
MLVGIKAKGITRAKVASIFNTAKAIVIIHSAQVGGPGWYLSSGGWCGRLCWNWRG